MKIKLVYKSKSGFTKRYAEWIAQQTGCKLIPVKAAGASILQGCDVLIYGSRMHAGRVDGLAKARKLFQESGASHFIVFVTGGMPASSTDTIEEMWRNNLTVQELTTLPHFYFQAGICYEKLGPIDRAMMKVAAFMMARQEKESKEEDQFLKLVRNSYDISDPQFISPLVDYLRDL